MDRPGSNRSKIVLIATDGAHAVCSEKVGLADFLKNNPRKNYVVSMSGIYCIIHEEALCGKRLKVQDVMNYVVKH